MGVTYKLRDEVVHFIISERQSNPLYSCRQLAESASQKFGLHLSKSSVHDVLKESGIVTPRGRKPKDKFKIPQEKKKQIQESLAQVKLLAPPSSVIASPQGEAICERTTDVVEIPSSVSVENSAIYEGAGKIFLKAALWDLGIYSEENIKEIDWDYYLTYCKGIKVVLENGKDFFIDLPLPIERCIRELADGLINNIKPLIVGKVSNEELFKVCMEAQKGFKMEIVSIVDKNDHILFEFNAIVEFKRNYLIKNRVFVENNNISPLERSKSIFVSQSIANNYVIYNIMNLKGYDIVTNDDFNTNLIIDKEYKHQEALQFAIETLKGMYLRDDQNRRVAVKVELGSL